MGIASLMAGLNRRIKDSQIPYLELPSGAQVSDLIPMTQMCTVFFGNLYSGSTPITPSATFWNHIYPTHLPATCASGLEAPISSPEIERAVGALARGKTPGIDGLPADLFRAHKTELVPAFRKLIDSIHMHNCVPPTMSEGRTILIPKKGNTALVENLRPITLMNADYKILAIILANRLQGVLPRVIHHAQTAFIKGRRIGDTINDTLDIMDWALTKKLPLLALTVDIRKAYDMVDREFLFRCLSRLGIPVGFITWVRRLHSKTHTHVSVNNSTGPRFRVLTGVRQGCPLAPLLFVCAIEVLQRHLAAALPGFAISPTQRRLMACYADDVTVFLNSDAELHTAKACLESFARCSEEHPNWSKCAILPFNMDGSSISSTDQIPIRKPNEAERILGIFVEQDNPGHTTWEQILSKVRNTANSLSRLHATTTCRSLFATERMASVYAFSGLQPSPAHVETLLDRVVGVFLSSSRYKEEGRAQWYIPKRILYNKKKHGGVGALEPSRHLAALNIQRACRRFLPTPYEDTARECCTLPYGLHCYLAHPDILKHLPESTPPRALAELKSLLDAPAKISKPRLEPWVLMAEPVAFNRFIHKPDKKPFGRVKDEFFLLDKQIRLGDLIRPAPGGSRQLTPSEFRAVYPPKKYPGGLRILLAIYKAVPDEWWDVLYDFTPRPDYLRINDWAFEADPTDRSPRVLRVKQILDDGRVRFDCHEVTQGRQVNMTPSGIKTLPAAAVITVCVIGKWLAGTFCSGAALGVRHELLRQRPSLATIRQQLYKPQRLNHVDRWNEALSFTLPSLPDLTHPFLKDQTSLSLRVLCSLVNFPAWLTAMAFSRSLFRAANAVKRSQKDGSFSRLCNQAFRPLTTELHAKLQEVVPQQQERIRQIKSHYGNLSMGKVTVNMAIGGMRGVKGLVWETSQLDPEQGIKFRGYSIPECQHLLPKAVIDGEPMPEGLLWLLLTGEVPTREQAATVTHELHERAKMPEYVHTVLNALPRDMHPMTQLSIGVMALQKGSRFARAYHEGMPKSKYWHLAYEDALDLIATLPQVAAHIYRHTFKDGKIIPPNEKLDYAANFAHMLGFNDPQFHDLMRLYLTIHADHEGGNVSAHATHLVGSALSDPYLSFAAGLNGLAGPLHGLANQEVLRWLEEVKADVGPDAGKDELRDFVWRTLQSGKVVPGYGHAVLRVTDPRYSCQRQFALKHLPHDPTFKLVSNLYEVVPHILLETGKVKNPWPNVDAHSGVLLQHYGLTEARWVASLVL
ncbi:unnamed protein product [Closterium sp. Yama58-4]|nr:unnamed protein product [Closterium sp. Yama58-4]